MYTYIVNFRLEENASYDERREQLISFFNPPSGYQSDATSTLMKHSPLDIECFENKLENTVTLDEKDYLLIFQVIFHAHIIRVDEYKNGSFDENLTLLNALRDFGNPFYE